MTRDIAVGLPVYSRTDALRQFLDSVPAYVTTAYIADNAPDASKAKQLARRNDRGVTVNAKAGYTRHHISSEEL
jgi:hypothetical protein